MLELENFPVLSIKNVISEGDYVVVESTGRTETDTERSGNPFYCDIYRFKNGKIQELTTYVVDTSDNNYR
jgi:ketosteroid isomerase-like protein